MKIRNKRDHTIMVEGVELPPNGITDLPITIKDIKSNQGIANLLQHKWIEVVISNE